MSESPNFVKIEKRREDHEAKIGGDSTDFIRFEKLRSLLKTEAETSADNESIKQAHDLLQKFENAKHSIAWETDVNRQKQMEEQLQKLNYLTKAEELLGRVKTSSVSKSTSIEDGLYHPLDAEVVSLTKSNPWYLGEEVPTTDNIEEKTATMTPDTFRSYHTNSPRRIADSEDLPKQDDYEESQEFARAQKKTQTINQVENRGIEVTKQPEPEAKLEVKDDTPVLSNQEQKPSGQYEYVGSEKPVANNIEVTHKIDLENISRPKERYKNASQRYLHDLRLLKDSQTKSDKQFLANVTKWLENSEKQYTQALKDLSKSGIDPKVEFTDLEQQINKLHKKLGWGERVESKPEKKSATTENIKVSLKEQITKLQEKFPQKTKERASRTAKVLALSLVGILASAGPAGKQGEVLAGVTTGGLGVGGQLPNNREGSQSAMGTVEISAETPQTEDLEVESTASVVPNADIVLEHPQTTPQESSVDSTPSRIVPLTTLPNLGSQTEQPLSYDNSVPPPPEPISETPVTSIENNPTVEIIESPASALLLRVAQDSTVSQAISNAYESGLFAPYLSRQFGSTQEFMDAYWAFDRVVNHNPELVKNILEIQSGSTDQIRAGESFKVNEILAIINGETTVAQLLERYREQKEQFPADVSVEAQAELDEHNQDNEPKETFDNPDSAQTTEVFVTPEAVATYRQTYDGGDEGWNRDFETYVRSAIPRVSNEGWMSRWFSNENESSGDVYQHFVEGGFTVAQFNALRDGDARSLREHLRENHIPIADFRALQSALYEIGMKGQVQIRDNMTLEDVLAESFVAEHSNRSLNETQ